METVHSLEVQWLELDAIWLQRLQYIISSVLKAQILGEEYMFLASKEKMRSPYVVTEQKQWAITLRHSVKQHHELIKNRK